MAVVNEALRRNGFLAEWLAFFTQVVIAISFQVGDDLGRSLVSQRGTFEGIANARTIVAFEGAHGLWMEPAWQLFFLHTQHILSLTVPVSVIERLINGMYVFGHLCVTLGVAAWIYFFRRPVFVLVRNIVIFTNMFALVVYESFPVAPPRLTTHLVFHGHPFEFQDTVFGVVNAGGKFAGSIAGYNEFSAMPSVHMAWALVAAGALLFLARPLLVKVLALFYPILMLTAIVVTGNHYFLDAVGGVLVVIAALPAAVAVEVWRGRTVHRQLIRVCTRAE